MNNLSSTIKHLIELRKRLILSTIGFVIILLCLMPFANNIYLILATPINKYLPTNTQLIATDITAPFFVPIKLTAILAFAISLPNTVYQLWKFAAPGLYKSERKIIISLIMSSIILFIVGILFCYFAVLPALFHFISGFKSSQITMLTDIDKYLSFMLSMFMIFGIAFETPILVFLLLKFQILQLKTATKIRKFIFVGAFVIAAIVTPPDVFSQTMLAIPLYLLYELGLLAAKILIKPTTATN